MTLYFAYGSNMDPVQMAARCPASTSIGVAELPGYTLAFPRHSPKRQCAVAGFRVAPGLSLWGVLYQVSTADLAALDQAEGMMAPGHPDNRYNRLIVMVLHDGKAMACETYAATPSPNPGLPSRAYLAHLINGALHHGLPGDYVAMLQRITAAPG